MHVHAFTYDYIFLLLKWKKSIIQMTHQYIHSQLLRKYRKDSKIKWIVKILVKLKRHLQLEILGLW